MRPSLRSLMTGALVALLVNGALGVDSTAPSTPPPLRLVADIPMPGDPVRFDYQSLDPVSGRLYIAHMNANQLVVFDLTTGRVLATHQVGESPDVLAFEPGLGRLYVSSETGTVSAFRERDKDLVLEGEMVMPHAHTVCVDPATHLVYFPLENLDGRPILWIMEPNPAAAEAAGR